MRKTKIAIWSAALFLLAAVLLLVNRPAPKPETGAAAGETPADFSVVCLNGETFTLSDHRGQTVVLNLWATWCGPCVEELEAFCRLQKERPDGVFVLALHVPPVTEDVAAFVQAHGYALPFAVADDALTETLGISDVLPQTLVIGPDGKVTYRHTGALTYEELISALP